MARIDIVRVKTLCQEGLLKAYIEGDGIYLNDTIAGEVVRLGDAPTIDAAPVVHGEWTETVEYRGCLRYHHITCSECGTEAKEKTPYCPHCPAKMDKEE